MHPSYNIEHIKLEKTMEKIKEMALTAEGMPVNTKNPSTGA